MGQRFSKLEMIRTIVGFFLIAASNRAIISLNCSGLGIGFLATFFNFWNPNMDRIDFQS
jgi:hypothetical protein